MYNAKPAEPAIAATINISKDSVPDGATAPPSGSVSVAGGVGKGVEGWLGAEVGEGLTVGVGVLEAEGVGVGVLDSEGVGVGVKVGVDEGLSVGTGEFVGLGSGVGGTLALGEELGVWLGFTKSWQSASVCAV